MSLATSKWANDLKKGIVNEFKKCFEDYVERLEKEAKEVVEMLEKRTDAKAKADPANKKMMKEELKETKERVKIFKENTKKQMKDILNTLKLNPGNNQFKYKSVFQDEFENFQKNMELFVSGEGELPSMEEPRVENIFIKFSSQPEIEHRIVEDPLIDDEDEELYPLYDESEEEDPSVVEDLRRMYAESAASRGKTRAENEATVASWIENANEERDRERLKRQRLIDQASELSFGGTRNKKKRQLKKKTKRNNK
jgi:hypothetical protein